MKGKQMNDTEIKKAIEPFARIARMILAEAPSNADYYSIYPDCEGVSHRETMDECRALVEAFGND